MSRATPLVFFHDFYALPARSGRCSPQSGLMSTLTGCDYSGFSWGVAGDFALRVSFCGQLQDGRRVSSCLPRWAKLTASDAE
jgi:hypothetical protein